LTVKFAVYAGILIHDEILGQIDIDGDKVMSEAELSVWVANTWAPEISISLDRETTIPVNGDTARATAPGQPDLVLVSNPLMIEVAVPIPADGLPHELLIRNDYESDRSDYDLQILAAPGTEGTQLSNNGRAMVIQFETDPEAVGGELSQSSFTTVLNSDEKSFGEKLMDNITIIGGGLLLLVALGWLGFLRWNEGKRAAAEAARVRTKADTRKAKAGVKAERPQNGARSEPMVRQNHASKKKPVAVRTIDAPDE
jgi:hypothetical protein